MVRTCWYRGLGAGTVALVLAAFVPACSPNAFDGTGGASDDPGAVTGEFVTYVADNRDGTTEWWHAVRTTDGREIRLNFDTPTFTATGSQVRIQGDMVGDRLHVQSLSVLPAVQIAAEGEPSTYESPVSPDTYALVLVDLGSGVNLDMATATADLNGSSTMTKSFAAYYNESSYGKYQVQGTVIGPYQYSMTTCDTTGMYQTIEPMITGTVPNHLIYYFNETSLCTFGGLGEEGSAMQPAKRTWMNGSLSCVVLMQEPGHNIGLMHANTMKCGNAAMATGTIGSFDTNPGTDCVITEYGSSMSTMGGGCREFNAYERWYEGWLSGCNGVKTTGGGTFNLVPLETSCTAGDGVQVLQVPFPAQLVVSDPQSTGTAVDLNNFYVELRTAGNIFDTFSSTKGGGGGFGAGVTFAAPTVFIYASDNVKLPTTTTGRGGTSTTRQSNSVWTELLNMSPSASSFAGLTTAGQSFTDPNSGGATITLNSISATGASVSVTYPGGGTATPTCIDGTTLSAPGPTSCSGSATATGGTTGTGGATATGGATGTGGTTSTGGTTGKGGTTGSGGTTTTGSGGATATGGTTGSGGATATGGNSGTGGGIVTGSGGNSGSGGATGSGGSNSGSGGSSGSGGTSEGTGGSSPNEKPQLTGGCSCSFDPAHPAGPSRELWLALSGLLGLVFARRPRKRS
jgi:MYXO-CTERM domain-containing protein